MCAKDNPNPTETVAVKTPNNNTIYTSNSPPYIQFSRQTEDFFLYFNLGGYLEFVVFFIFLAGDLEFGDLKSVCGFLFVLGVMTISNQ